MNITAFQVEKALRRLGSKEKAAQSVWFFKTGKGEYGEGDVFIGVTVPEERQVAKKFAELPLSEIERLLQSPLHECRLSALFILNAQFLKADEKQRKELVRFYLSQTKRINNWNLVDASAPYILGRFLVNKSDKEKAVLYRLARSKNLWERRIGVVATWMLIRNGEVKDTLLLSEILLSDTHDLMHKAVGWMLREVGKKDVKALERFLHAHAGYMPRTMLRYALEKFPEKKRKAFMAKAFIEAAKKHSRRKPRQVLRRRV